MGMISTLARKVEESLFFIPAVVITACIALAALALYLDSEVPEFLGDLRFVIAPTVAGARSIVSTVAGATITVAAIVFSITALSTQIAANQYSPRAVKGFFEDRFQQLVIGFVVGTFSYSLVVLTGLGSVVPSPESTSSSVSVTLAIAFGVLSPVAIVAYIDHSLRRMQIDEVVRRIAEETVASIRHHSRDFPRGPNYSEARDPEGEPVSLNSKKTGWVQGIRPDRILSALARGAMARVEVRPGEAVSEGDVLLTYWPAGSAPDSIDEAALMRGIEVRRERSIENDPSFGIRLLIDIALRALSPGIHDPTTAVDVLHHLKLPMRELLTTDAPARVHTGPDGEKVYLPEVLSTSGQVHAAFAEIRLAAAEQPYVIKTLVEILSDLMISVRAADREGQEAAILTEARLAVEALRHSGLPERDIEWAVGSTGVLDLD